MTPEITASDLIKKYSVLLLDAYGVLVDKNSALPGAKNFIDHLNSITKPYFIVTNDASKQPDSLAKKYHSVGLQIAKEKIITSGSLLKKYFKSNNLTGAKCIALGSEEACLYVKEAGGELVPLVSKDTDAAILVICGGAGYPLLETIDLILSVLFRMIDSGKSIKMLLPNPDFIYPKSKGYFGMTTGSIALILENALQLRYPNRNNLSFIRLGKPNKYIYEEAMSRCQTKDMVMVGDQVLTDIRGAKNFGINSVLIGTGITKLEELKNIKDVPNYVLHNLDL